MARKLSREQIEELKKCRSDVAYFVTTYGWLRHTSRGAIRWDKPYTYQLKLLRTLQEGDDVVLNKSRRVGASWTVCAFALWLTIFFPDKSVLILSRKEMYAKGLIKRIKFMFNHLPAFLKPRLTVDTQTEMTFTFKTEDGVADSNIVSLTTTTESGRGEDAVLVIMDEAAFLPNAEETWAAVKPTTAFGGQVAVISTPNGCNGFFHRIVSRLKSGHDIGFTYIEAHYARDCGLSEEWMRKASMGFTTTQILQEFELQFITANNPFFDLTQLALCYKPLGEHPEMAQFMQKTAMNFGGVDTSEIGVVKGGEPDFHSIVVLNELGVQIYAWNNNEVPQREFSGYTYELLDGTRVEVESYPSKVHREYPGAMVIERFGAGDVTAANHKVPDDGISYMVPRRVTNTSKVRGLNALRRGVNDLSITITDPFTYSCFQSFEDKTRGIIQKFGAADGAFDDPVMAFCHAYSEWLRHGGRTLDLTDTVTTSGQRMVALRQEEDLLPNQIRNVLPVGRVTHGPIWDRERDLGENARMTDELEEYRSGRRLPAPRLRERIDAR